MKPSLTVVIQTRNESASIQDCIASAKLLSDDILLVDMESTDDTVAKATTTNARITSFPYSRYVEPARRFGIEQATGDWIFILDADERIDQTLAKEIFHTLENSSHTHFKIPRKNVFGMKHWLRHGGWWPDHQMRLIQKAAFKDWPARIHATPDIEGTIGYLKTPILHYFHGDVEKMVEKTIQFEDIEATLLFEADRTVGTQTFFRKFFGELNRRLVKHVGFADGTVGILESVYQAFSKTITWLYLYEKKKNRTI